MALIFTARCRV